MRCLLDGSVNRRVFYDGVQGSDGLIELLFYQVLNVDLLNN
jgi:hypothetical protein